MGGVLIIGTVFVSCVLWARPDNRFVWLALFAMIYLGALGFADDYLKVTKKKSDGISSRLKFAFQVVLAVIIAAVSSIVSGRPYGDGLPVTLRPVQ